MKRKCERCNRPMSTQDLQLNLRYCQKCAKIVNTINAKYNQIRKPDTN